ncbi:Smr/MutS family protein [bacterium]|jgi:DNA-nicking Smr family endonuclease|nr:Smr/MutS family protein [bacterium]MBT4649381.1 Smr/MutS family protein [bacterium]
MSNKYAKLNKPQAEFDFHNSGILNRPEIIKLTDEFIKQAIENDYKLINFIVGQGKHSKNGAIIKPLLQKYLSSHPQVKKIQPGKFAQGGEGVLIIDLI